MALLIFRSYEHHGVNTRLYVPGSDLQKHTSPLTHVTKASFCQPTCYARGLAIVPSSLAHIALETPADQFSGDN